MRQSRTIMGMPVELEIIEKETVQSLYDDVFALFLSVDERFSTYKEQSEISRINRGNITQEAYSADVREVFQLSEKTQVATQGYFNIHAPDGTIDPSGLVKGWAIQKAAELLREAGSRHFYIEIGGDIQTEGLNANGQPWRIGIRNPFNLNEIVKVIYPKGKGVATSGTYIRGTHIYDPHTHEDSTHFVSLTVIGPNVYEADRFATAAFAMGKEGMPFLEQLPEIEAYAIDRTRTAFMTSGFDTYTRI